MDTTIGGLDHSEVRDPKVESQIPLPREIEKRCTDFPCFLVFLFFNICLWTLTGWAYFTGNPGRLKHGWDVNGSMCGQGEMQGRAYTYFPIPLQSVDVTLCLPGCPSLTAEESICLYDSQGQDDFDTGCFNAYKSKPFFNLYCLPGDYHMRRRVTDWLYTANQSWDVLAIGALIAGGAMVIYLISFLVPSKRYAEITFPLFVISVPVLLFLLAVMCYLIYEESWRVNGTICGSFGSVQMEECDEGDIANGYKDLCWVMLAVSAVVACVLFCLLPKLRRGLGALALVSKVHRFHLALWICPAVALILGVGFYAYFLTLLIYQVSCGYQEAKTVPVLPQGFVESWYFTPAERVLVFFNVGMILWWFSFIAHTVEFVTGSLAYQWFGDRTSKPSEQLRKAIFQLFRYHIGSVLLASVLIPSGRLLRNVFSGLKTVFSRFHLTCRFCLSLDNLWFKYVTSDALAYHLIKHEKFVSSAVHGHNLVASRDNIRVAGTLNSGNYVIWVFQLVIMMIAPVFVAYWIQHQPETFKSLNTEEVTSVTAMSIYVLFLSWYLAQLYGGFVRGVLHGSVLAYLEDAANKAPGDRVNDPDFVRFIGDTVLDVPEIASKVTPNPPEEVVRPVATTTGSDGKAAAARAAVEQIQPVPPPSRGELQSVDRENPNQSIGEGANMITPEAKMT